MTPSRWTLKPQMGETVRAAACSASPDRKRRMQNTLPETKTEKWQTVGDASSQRGHRQPRCHRPPSCTPTSGAEAYQTKATMGEPANRRRCMGSPPTKTCYKLEEMERQQLEAFQAEIEASREDTVMDTVGGTQPEGDGVLSAESHRHRRMHAVVYDSQGGFRGV